MGRISVQFEVANFRDLVKMESRLLTPDKVRRLVITGIADSGSTRLVLPDGVAKELGLQKTEKVMLRYADGRTARRDTVDGVYVQLLGRHGIFTAALEKNRETALIGAIVLEDLDLLVDCTTQQLRPRDPNIVVSEVE